MEIMNRPADLGNPNESKRFYDNSKATQRTRILRTIEKRKQMSTFDLRDELGIVHPAGRIKELREEHDITLSWTRQSDQNGVIHRIGMYTYVGLKNQGGV